VNEWRRDAYAAVRAFFNEDAYSVDECRGTIVVRRSGVNTDCEQTIVAAAQ
jgi:hypothetical protein